MRPRRILDELEAAEILDRAVKEHALAVVTLREDDDWHTFKSRFLERDVNRRFFVLDCQETHGATPPPLTVGQHIGISFRHKSRKVMFASVVEARGKFMVEDGSSVSAIRYRWPDALTELQRRAYYRTPVPSGTAVRVSIWSGGIRARGRAQERPLEIITGKSADLSCGGTLIQLSTQTAPALRNDQVVGAEIGLPDGRPPLVLDAYFRGIRTDADGSPTVAIQFVGLELSADGRNILKRLARCIQKFHRQSFVTESRPSTGTSR